MGKASVTSTKVKVKYEKATDILSKYQLQDIGFVLDKEGYLHFVGENGGSGGWPQAVSVMELPKKEEYDDEESYWDYVQCVYLDEGDEGFTALLRELATCIETPMMILAVSGIAHISESCVWVIQPGAVHVEKLCAYEGPGDNRDEKDG